MVTLGTAFTIRVGLMLAELLPPSVTLIVGLYVVAVVSVPDIAQVVPVTELHPLGPAGRPLDVQVSVPPPHPLAVIV